MKHKTNKVRNEITFLVLNIRSLNNNYDKLIDLLAETKIDPTIIIITELWITNEQKFLYTIPNYKLVIKKSFQRAGGSGIFLKQDMEFEQINTLELNLAQCEDVWIKIKTQQRSHLIVGSVYRHPGQDVKQFEEEFNNCLEKLHDNGGNYVVAGDFNIDLNKNDKNTKNYKNDIESHGCVQIIKEPTRYSYLMNPAILDHIYTNLDEEKKFNRDNAKRCIRPPTYMC